jgi:hypothetical protein
MSEATETPPLKPNIALTDEEYEMYERIGGALNCAARIDPQVLIATALMDIAGQLMRMNVHLAKIANREGS